ncbi:flagellar hook capping FlgD N-terminal domain-containing protein [Chromobacterium violaceum]|uniref:Basal-body rod modification protein FlgD n=1 Tax=Chromobacterium violaceum TaxID=536 RepID=A0A202B998_CHRVL|nr:flagellar hook capping FlgD N-terminal domain-containing protein [Chromobacterium violaceum]KJH68637.1 flagellar basal body rod modification protein FlgD [Chromobacterium violaceum]MBA8735161.1 flagellar hook assembly protein FlgD [Chromobacterium violaceum]OVE47910.1 flagellar biosynthesis protein FlgD [Chromobacterium violaceum]
MSVEQAQARQFSASNQQGGEQKVAPAAGKNGAQPSNDMFMTLLLAQIRNQSPLDPADPSQFVSQLAQMSQMQSTQDMLKQLQSQGAMLRELQGVALGAQVGKPVLLQTDRIRSDGQGELNGRLTLSGQEESATLILTDAAGQRTRIDLGKREAGASDFKIKLADYHLAAGNYQVELSTASGSKGLFELKAEVSGVRLPVNGGEPVLSLAGLGDFPASSVSALLSA